MNSEDEQAFHRLLRNDAVKGIMQTRCEEYLDTRTYRKRIVTSVGDSIEALELYAPDGSHTIQKLVDNQEQLGNVRLESPAPDLLPIKIMKISDDHRSYVIPSEVLALDAILPHSVNYLLAAILCDINHHAVVFVQRRSTRQWYYMQSGYECEQLSDHLNAHLNRIIDSRSLNEQQHLIDSAHFVLSVLFYNSVKYVYERDDEQ